MLFTTDVKIPRKKTNKVDEIINNFKVFFTLLLNNDSLSGTFATLEIKYSL